MHDEIREIHEYSIRLADAVRNYAHNRRNPARQVLNDWWNHKSMVCPQPDTLTNENLDQFLSDDPSRQRCDTTPLAMQSMLPHTLTLRSTGQQHRWHQNVTTRP